MIFLKKNLSIKLVKNDEELLFKKIFNLYFREILKLNFIPKNKINSNLNKIKNNMGKINWILDKNKKIGFVIFFLNNKKLNCYVRDYFILKNFRKKEIGSLIFKKIIANCKKRKFKFIKIDIIETNKKVFNFWKKLNFKKNGKSYYFKLNK